MKAVLMFQIAPASLSNTQQAEIDALDVASIFLVNVTFKAPSGF